MARLYRPHIPLSVRCKVAERQAAEKPNEMWNFYLATGWHPTMHFRRRLTVLMQALAMRFGCTVSELRLDHDPPLGARQKAVRSDGRHVYLPDANSPDHLVYRPHGPQHAGSHLIKTNVRGEHGQHPDRVLIKKARRLTENKPPKRKVKIQSRGFDKASRPFAKRKS